MYFIPQPQHLQEQAGSFRLTRSHRITLTCPASCLATAQLLAKAVEQSTGLALRIDRRGGGKVHPGIVLQLASGKAQSYTLEITPEGVTVTGGDEPGLFYGVQTLGQILCQSGCVLPCLSIQDYPALPVRGLFYDVTRCRVPTLAFLKTLADRCNRYKMNQLHLYIEHTFLFDGLSEVWRDDTPLTAQDILELDEYCKGLHIDLVPSIATLSHLYKVLRTKTYHHLSELEEAPGAEFSFHQRMGHHTLNTTDEEAFALVCRMIDEYAPLFSSRLFNINGDEPFDLGKGRGSAKAKEIGAHQMYVDWLARVCRHVESLGKQPMFWGDVILSDPESIAQLPENIVCMNWDYSPTPREDHAKALAATGVAQYLCPGVQGWKQTINLFDVAYANIRKMAELAHRYHAQGLLVTEWGDYGHLQDPESTVPGLIYAAAMGWNSEIPEEDQLNQAVSLLEYGDRSKQVMAVLRRLSQQAAMQWGQAVEFSEVQRGRIPGKTMDQFWAESRLPAGKAAEANGIIDQCQEALGRLMPQMDPAGRQRMLPYFLLSDGQKLLNRFMAQLDIPGYGREAQEDPRTLAGDLETWYHDYAGLWRRTSQESELYRLGEVIFWMADFLRAY